MAASVGAGISMGFAEALADDGKLSGRGTPLLRGLVCGLMTIAGGIGHTLPYLIPSFWTATSWPAIVVLLELIAIAYIQFRYMDTPPMSAVAKVMLGGALVLAVGIADRQLLRLPPRAARVQARWIRGRQRGSAGRFLPRPQRFKTQSQRPLRFRRGAGRIRSLTASA